MLTFLLGCFFLNWFVRVFYIFWIQAVGCILKIMRKLQRDLSNYGGMCLHFKGERIYKKVVACQGHKRCRLRDLSGSGRNTFTFQNLSWEPRIISIQSLQETKFFSNFFQEGSERQLTLSPLSKQRKFIFSIHSTMECPECCIYGRFFILAFITKTRVSGVKHTIIRTPCLYEKDKINKGKC